GWTRWTDRRLSGKDVAAVPTAVAAHFVARHGGRLERLPGFDHACCWVRHWPALLARAEGGR
ncbi:MAG TPA: hypothetical protein VFY62_08380, partial [Pseudomonas sp.]|nr:hypothetical protein [Pseudomonas sp.]